VVVVVAYDAATQLLHNAQQHRLYPASPMQLAMAMA
jgi:hypothetical protein